MEIALSALIAARHRSMMTRLYTSFPPAMAGENQNFPQ